MAEADPAELDFSLRGGLTGLSRGGCSSSNNSSSLLSISSKEVTEPMETELALDSRY